MQCTVSEQRIFNTDDVVAAFSRRPFNMSLNHGDTQFSKQNRGNFLKECAIDASSLVCASQVHGDQVEYVTEQDRGKGAVSVETAFENTDALITDKRNVALSIFTADCLSIFVYDSQVPCIGLIHAGWRGSQKNIVQKTLAQMRQRFGLEPARAQVFLGPSIRACCYEVGKEFNEYFKEGVTAEGNRFFLDLAVINKKALIAEGVLEQHISDCRLCTSCQNDTFFSYRRDGEECGRIMSVMMLK